MKNRVVIGLLFIVFISVGLFIYNQPVEAEKEPYTLQNAMQDRMADMLRIKESLQNGQIPEKKINTRYVGLPHSEFVDDVSQHQGTFAVFDSLYAEMFKLNDGEIETFTRHYNTLAQTCASCHKLVCPGPLRSINKLKI